MPSTGHRMNFPVFVRCSQAGSGRSTRICRHLFRAALLACLTLWAIPQAVAKEYQTYNEAMADAEKALKAKNYLASQEPLEAAIKLAENDSKRIQVYRKLFPAYQLNPDIDDMLKACEFILDHSGSAPEKSLVRGELLEFVGKREKTDDVIDHFESRLSKNENDRTAMFVLSEAYTSQKKDPAKGAEYLERFTKTIETSGEKVDVLTYAELATLYVKSKQYQAGAELFEKITSQDEAMAPWHWKEAAAAWLRSGEKEKALEAARNATKAGPETRSDLLNYYWNNALGDIYLELENPTLAINHYEAALKVPKIASFYVKKTQASLEKAREKAK